MELKFVCDGKEIEFSDEPLNLEFEGEPEIDVKQFGRNSTIHLKFKPTAKLTAKLLIYMSLLEMLQKTGANPDDKALRKWAWDCAFSE